MGNFEGCGERHLMKFYINSCKDFIHAFSSKNGDEFGFVYSEISINKHFTLDSNRFHVVCRVPCDILIRQ